MLLEVGVGYLDLAIEQAQHSLPVVLVVDLVAERDRNLVEHPVDGLSFTVDLDQELVAVSAVRPGLVFIISFYNCLRRK